MQTEQKVCNVDRLILLNEWDLQTPFGSATVDGGREGMGQVPRDRTLFLGF